MILQHSERRASRRAAFTLMEVLVVAVILLIMAGGASIAYFEYMKGAKADRAHMDCIALKQAMDTAAIQNAKKGLQQPQSLQDAMQWIEGGQEKLNDPWGQPYQFRWDMINNKQAAIVSTTNPDTGEVISSAQ
jgi:prepilin-type N-terminal cleavage/methylation domain-containing protein